MTQRHVIENKISAVKKYLNILSRYRKYTQKEIEKSLDLRGAVERYLYLAAQATIDLAESVIAFKHFRKPTTFSEAFQILCEERLLQPALTEKMIRMTGFRNIIAHDYEDLDYSIVYQILQKGVNDIQSFLRQVEKI